MVENIITCENFKEKDDKQCHFNEETMDEVMAALMKKLPAIEVTAPDMEPKPGTNEFQGPCPFCKERDGDAESDQLTVWPEDGGYSENRYYCRKCPEGMNKGNKIHFYCRLNGNMSITDLAHMYVPEVMTPDPQSTDLKKEINSIHIDFSAWWKKISMGDEQKSKIHEFLNGERGIDPKVVDKHIANENLKYESGKEDLHVLVAYKGKDTLPAVQTLTIKSKAFKQDSEVSSECFFIAGCEAKKTNTIMLHAAVIDALSGECLYPDICHVALGSTTLTGKISGLKAHEKRILVAQDNDSAGEKMLMSIADILGSEVMGINWSETAKKKMSMNDILRLGQRPQIEEVFVRASVIINDGFIDGLSLSKKTFDLIKWAVEGLIAEGVNLLAGKPKCGKSILCLNLSTCIASGKKAFGTIDVEQGEVLYLALEDVQRRLQERLNQMIPNAGNDLQNIQVTTEWPKMGEGGIKKLAAALKKRPNTRLVIIDTLQMFRPAEVTGKKLYNADYEPIARIKKAIADKFKVPVLIIHHLRKSEADDIFDTMSGSTGLTGATDSNIIFEKGADSSSATLHVQGRDIETASHAMKLNPDTLTWEFLGDAKDIKSTDMKQKLYDTIKVASGPLSPKEIEDITGLKGTYIRKTLRKLMQEGGIKQQSRGKYIYSEPEKQLTDSQ